MFRGKNYKESAKLIDKQAQYEPQEAFELITKTAKAKFDEALDAGADYAGGQDLVAKIQGENWFEFDTVIASPNMMGVVGRLGKVLGPKGLMPSPKAGTVTPNSRPFCRRAELRAMPYRMPRIAR